MSADFNVALVVCVCVTLAGSGECAKELSCSYLRRAVTWRISAKFEKKFDPEGGIAHVGVNMQFPAAVHGRAALANAWRKWQPRPRQQGRISNGDRGKKNTQESRRRCRQTEDEKV